MNAIRQRLITAILLACVCAPAIAADGASDRTAMQGDIGNYGAFGADELAWGETSPAAPATHYLFIAGSAFNTRTSVQVVTYPGAGCKYSDQALTTDLQLPQGASIRGVRTYYYNDGQPAASVRTFLTSYNGAGENIDHLSMPSTLSTGFANEYFDLPSALPVDDFNRSYVLTATMGAGLRLCGMRVFYETP